MRCRVGGTLCAIFGVHFLPGWSHLRSICGVRKLPTGCRARAAPVFAGGRSLAACIRKWSLRADSSVKLCKQIENLIDQVIQRTTGIDRNGFTSALKGCSQPDGSMGPVLRAAALIRSPFKDRSILPACDVNSGA